MYTDTFRPHKVVIKRWADGAPIQIGVEVEGEILWEYIAVPTFDENHYRVIPEYEAMKSGKELEKLVDGVWVPFRPETEADFDVPATEIRVKHNFVVGCYYRERGTHIVALCVEVENRLEFHAVADGAVDVRDPALYFAVDIVC